MGSEAAPPDWGREGNSRSCHPGKTQVLPLGWSWGRYYTLGQQRLPPAKEQSRMCPQVLLGALLCRSVKGVPWPASFPSPGTSTPSDTRDRRGWRGYGHGSEHLSVNPQLHAEHHERVRHEKAKEGAVGYHPILHLRLDTCHHPTKLCVTTQS